MPSEALDASGRRDGRSSRNGECSLVVYGHELSGGHLECQMPHPAVESMSDPLQRGVEPFHDEAIVLSLGVPDLDELHLLVGSADHVGEQPGRDGTVERGRDAPAWSAGSPQVWVVAAKGMAAPRPADRHRHRRSRRSIMRDEGLVPCQPRPWRASLTENDHRPGHPARPGRDIRAAAGTQAA
jgi:hypothetical protein